jgi:Uncharacterized conserved protein
MIAIRTEEQQAKIFLRISAVIYLVTGFLFVIIPDWILSAFNWLSFRVLPSLPLTPIGNERFWNALAFSMMMTITAICIAAQYNIRKNKHLVIILLLAKSASSVSALVLFLFSAPYLSYLGIFLVDGALFLITLIFYLRANRAFFEEQTFYLHRPPAQIKTTPPTTVVAHSGDDKLVLLDRVLDESGFFDILDRRFQSLGKSKTEFKIAIKPNFMFTHSKRDISTYTDPELVEALVTRIAERGYPNIAIVESQSTYGNYYSNREVLKVAEHVGYSTTKNYRIVDLTEEKVPFDYGGRLGRHFVGPTWRDADFRISFAKNKTHVFCHYTLTLKNIYGTLPMQNKLKEYHTKREYDWPTIESLKHFPVHFGLIDAVWSADGQFGVIVDPKPNHTKTIIGGENLIAVDWVGAKKMGLEPDAPHIGRFLPLAVEAFGRPVRIDWTGDKEVYRPWTNVNEFFIKSLDLIEEAGAFSDWWFSCLTAMDPYFKFKITALPRRIMRKLLAPVKRRLYRFDQL